MEEEKYPELPSTNYAADDIYFKTVSEDEAIQIFTKDGYTGFKSRANRFRNTPKDGKFATQPSVHHIAYEKDTDKPVGVIGYAPYKEFLLGSGIHVRDTSRGKGLMKLLFREMIRVKGNRKLIVNFSSKVAMKHYLSEGFRQLDESELPDELINEISIGAANGNVGTLEKYYIHSSSWWAAIKTEVI